MKLRDFLASSDKQAVLEKTVARASSLNKKLNCFITLNSEKPKVGEGKLSGLPVSVKDCICTKNLRSTAGSKILDTYIPPFDATVVAKIKSEGAHILGKTAQDEFGFGTFSTNCAFGTPKNPWDTKRSCGGSSGGAGAIAATLEPHAAIAESTGGSISCPAAFTGTVGITPTYGLVSRYGLIDYANSLDKIGTIGKTIDDSAFLLEQIMGHDPRDATSLNRLTPRLTSSLKKDVKGMTLGIPKEYYAGVPAPIKNSVLKALDDLKSLGVKTKQVSLPTTPYAIPTYYILAVSEASTNLAKFSGLRYGHSVPIKSAFDAHFSRVRTEGFGKEAKRRILLGTFARMAGYRDQYYLKALKVRSLIIDDFKRAFKKCDALAAPTMPLLPPKFSDIKTLTPVQNYMMDVLTVGPNLAGIPMISTPCGFSKGLPIGLHLMGDHFSENKLVSLASAYEQLTKHTERRPL